MGVTTKRFHKREAILSCLRSTKTHPSAEWVFEQLKPQIPDLSLGTVYRNLALFKEQGIITSVGHVNGVERFDGNPKPHVHFVCQSCAQVTDLMAVEIPSSLSLDVEKESGCRVTGCNVTFFGTCKSCLE